MPTFCFDPKALPAAEQCDWPQNPPDFSAEGGCASTTIWIAGTVPTGLSLLSLDDVAVALASP